MSERLTKEREAQIRADVAACAIDADDAAALLAELDAVRAERDAIAASASAYIAAGERCAEASEALTASREGDDDREIGALLVASHAAQAAKVHLVALLGVSRDR